MDSAVEQINENLLTEFTVDYELDKDGTRKVRYVIFKLTPRKYWNNPSEAPAEVKAAAQEALTLQEQIRAANAGVVKISKTDTNALMFFTDAATIAETTDIDAMSALLAQNEMTEKTLELTAHMSDKTTGVKEEIPDILNNASKVKRNKSKNTSSQKADTEQATKEMVSDNGDVAVYAEQDPYDILQQLTLLP